MRDRAASSLHPVMLPLLHQHRTAAAADPLCGPTELIETYRDETQQDADFAKGRDPHGNVIDKAAVVTFKRGGSSRHGTRRWARICPDCPHEAQLHLGGGTFNGSAVLACSAEGHNLGEGCHCAIAAARLTNESTWRMVPASLAYHLALHCRGCHPAGSLLGFGAHERLGPDDLRRYSRLAAYGQAQGLRSGMDWDGDRIYLEKGESDLTHFELASVGPLEQVKAMLAIKGKDLTWPTRDAGIRT